MNRRALLGFAAAAAAIGAAARPGAAQAPAAAAPGPKLDAWSKNLQWLRAPKDLAKGVREMGLASVDLTVAAYPGHIDPAKIRADLPPYVSALKQEGIAVTAIDCAILDNTPNADAILATASGAGIRYFSMGKFQYDKTKPYQPQLDAIKARVGRVVALAQKYRMKALYQPGVEPGAVGAAFFDMLDVMRNFDPRYVGFRYDTASLLPTQRDVFVTHMRLATAYIGAMALNDGAVELELPLWEEGPFTGDPNSLPTSDRGGDNVGRDGGTAHAFGGGGKPLPYKYNPMPLGTGMIDLTLIGTALREIGFYGPMETQVLWPLDNVENGADKITRPRQQILGRLKRDRLVVEQTFGEPWGFKPARPPFMQNRPAGAQPPGEG